MRPACIAASIVLLMVAACETTGSGPGDGATDHSVQPALDGTEPGEAGAAPVVDFVVVGCERRTATQCVGRVPLSLTFTAVLEKLPRSATWNLGDGSEATGLVASHTYTSPGTYNVTLTTGDAGGTTSARKRDLVVVERVGPGAPCTSTAQCAHGTCACTAAHSCTPPLDRGVCLVKCEDKCPQTPYPSLCVDLKSPSAGGGAEPWRTTLCLPRCTTDADCARPGFSCRHGPGTSGWQRACLPANLRDVGQPCRGPAGSPLPELCLGATCLGIGASGYCSAACQAGTCPSGSRCAEISGLVGAVCLAQCSSGSCSTDPLLACELPGGSGSYGFTILGAPPPGGTTFCAAKRCTGDSQCGLLGTCDSGSGGFCLPASSP